MNTLRTRIAKALRLLPAAALIAAPVALSAQNDDYWESRDESQMRSGSERQSEAQWRRGSRSQEESQRRSDSRENRYGSDNEWRSEKRGNRYGSDDRGQSDSRWRNQDREQSDSVWRSERRREETQWSREGDEWRSDGDSRSEAYSRRDTSGDRWSAYRGADTESEEWVDPGDWFDDGNTDIEINDNYGEAWSEYTWHDDLNYEANDDSGSENQGVSARYSNERR